MLILGIETSCDETSVAILRGENQILSNIVSSSLFRHKEWGGVVPEIASRHCLEQIEAVYEEALKQAQVKKTDLNLIAVTEGPGLIGSLFVGMGFAKALAYQLNIPLVAVNHLEAHWSAGMIGKPAPEKFIGLLVSGGHTFLSFCANGKYEMLGQTEDDAVGEAYDKIAKMLGLEYPGGPLLDKLAAKGNPKAVKFQKPKQENALDFSFSGVKTAALYALRDMKTGERKKDAPSDEDLSASFQAAAISWLVDKTLAACELKKTNHVIVGGGVSANSLLRRELPRAAAEKGIEVVFPPFELTGDNAAMIARRGLDLFRQGKMAALSLTANPNLRLV